MFRLPVPLLNPLKRLAFCFLLVLTLRTAAAENVNPIKPLQTELVASLDISRVKVGSPVLLKVDVDWVSPGCTLRAGSIVQGHVVELTKRSKGVKDSELQLIFDAAECDAHHENPFSFALVAIVGSEQGNTSTGQADAREAPPLADAIGNAIGGAGGGIRSAQAASALNSGFDLPVRHLPAQILPGQVLGVKKTVLNIGASDKDAATVRALGHDLRLEQGTSLILMHSDIAPGVVRNAAQASASGDHAGETAPPASSAGTGPLLEPPDETDVCTERCNIVEERTAETRVQDSAATASIAMRRLGYAPRKNQEVTSFDYQTALTYLDPHNLLCTFDPHQLRERTGPDQEDIRTIKAVLIDTDSRTIKRIMTWRVQGDEQYLWRLADGKILVHMRHELKEFDAQLKTLRSIPLGGRVGWLVASPTGDHIAIGTVRERHSEEVHRDLTEMLADSPEEDVEVQVFNKDRSVILTAIQSSKIPQPVLSDSGELRLHGDGHTHWKISEYHWDRTEQKIAAVTSTCRPILATPARDLIFAVGCTSSGGRWYRMLRADGHLLLKGVSASDEIQHFAQGTDGEDFAVRTVTAVRAMSYGQPFKKTDLTQEKIAVYRSRDGATLASVATADFVLSHMAFALSPTGEEIAVIGDSSISFYPIRLH
jgi:hypothetical protein